MSTHVPLGLWFGGAAALVLVCGAVTIVLWRVASGQARSRLLGALAAWLGLAILLGALGVFATTYQRPVPVIAVGIVLPIVVGVLLLRRPGSVIRLLHSISPRALIGVQFYRVAGVIFVIAWAAGRMPAIFALPAGVGDVLVGLAAPLVAARVGDGTARSRRIAVGWNIAGIADLVLAVALGAATSPTSLWPTLLGHPNPLISRLPLVLIPVFAVPLSVLVHLIALRRLAAPVWEHERPPVDAESRARPMRTPAVR